MNQIDYPFIRYPRALIASPLFSHISIEARTLLAMILDRHELSEINSERFSDENGRIYVIYTIEEICQKLGCGNKKATKLCRELEANEMICRKRTNGSRPSKIFLTQHFINALKQDFAKCQYDLLQNVGTAPCKASKTPSIYNKNNNNNISNNKSSTAVTDDEIKEQIEYECLYCEEWSGMLDEIVMIISDVLNGTSPTVRIGRDDMPRELVIQRFNMLEGEHIMSILWQLGKNKTKIRNMKAYLIMKLYNEVEAGECELTAALAMLYPES